jgi:hypothetical protein
VIIVSTAQNETETLEAGGIRSVPVSDGFLACKRSEIERRVIGHNRTHDERPAKLKATLHSPSRPYNQVGNSGHTARDTAISESSASVRRFGKTEITNLRVYAGKLEMASPENENWVVVTFFDADPKIK